jgi:hypothetical protein
LNPKIKEARSAEKSFNYPPNGTQIHIPEVKDLQEHCCGILKTHTKQNYLQRSVNYFEKRPSA